MGKPNVLKFTQVSVDIVRQMASFAMARPKKNAANRFVMIIQPASVKGIAPSITILRYDWPFNSPNPRMPPNNK